MAKLTYFIDAFKTIDAYKNTTLHFENEEDKILFEANRLEQIRENWKTMFLILRIIASLVGVALLFSTDGIVIIRTISIIVSIVFLTILNYIIDYSDFAAKYCG